MPSCAWTMPVSDSVPRGDDHADERQALGDLVGDQLRGAAHRAQERVLRARGPAAEHDPVEGDRAEREQVQRADRDVDPVQADLACRRCSGRSPNGMIASAAIAVRIEISGASANRKPIDVRGRNCSLDSSLTMSAIGCSSAERADAVGAVAALEAPEQLALGEQHERDELQADREDHERLDDLDPPGLVVADVGEHGLGSSRRAAPPPSGTARRRARWPSRSGDARRPGTTVPAATPARSGDGRPDAVPFWATSTRSPWPTPSRRASCGRELDALVRVQELQRGRDLDLGRGPDRAERAQAQRPSARGGAGGRLGRRTAPARRGEARRPPRAPASARRGRRSPRASARRRTGTASNSCCEAIAPVSDAEVEPEARGRARRATRHPARTSPGRPIAGRSRCRRPSGWTTVPSFSA